MTLGADILERIPRYQCHKVVRALRIKEVRPLPDLTGGGRIIPFEEGIPPFDVPPVLFARYQPVPGDYYVIYGDGYFSFSPAQAFEEGYTLISTPATENATTT